VTEHPACIREGGCFLAQLSDDAQAVTVVDNEQLCHWRDCAAQIVEDAGLASSDTWTARHIERIRRNAAEIRDAIAGAMRDG
jgi:hypothetical protein